MSLKYLWKQAVICMSDNINSMNFKQLKNEVQSLRDEIAIMKRKYGDIIYNLDDDNFSSRFVKEKGDMRTAIEINAEGIKTKVSNEDFESTKTQTANLISSEVKKLSDKDTELSTKIEQTADTIRSEVKSATDTLDGKFANYSTIEQTAEAIKSHAYASADLSSAEEISNLNEATDITKTYVISATDGSGNVTKTYYYYNDISKEWEVINGGGIDTVFEQTAEGFKLKGNVLIDGDTVVTENLKLSGNVTWDMSNSPVLTRYSSDNANWHSPMVSGDLYMQMSFDGGKSWSTTTKVVGTDGKDGQDGWDGSDANVTPQNVFNALTDNGANQGIFAAFVKNNNQIYINAEYLATKIANVHDVIYLGNENTVSSQKKIVFNDAANIRTFLSGAGYHYGLAISANGLNLEMKPDEIEFIHPNSGSFGAGSISLADYVASYGSGGTGGTATAVFG